MNKKIAKNHGVTWQEVRQQMQFALNDAYTNPNRSVSSIVYQEKVPRKEQIPTPEEFIRYASNKVTKNQKND